jgi:hypothetical protein
VLCVSVLALLGDGIGKVSCARRVNSYAALRAMMGMSQLRGHFHCAFLSMCCVIQK